MMIAFTIAMVAFGVASLCAAIVLLRYLFQRLRRDLFSRAAAPAGRQEEFERRMEISLPMLLFAILLLAATGCGFLYTALHGPNTPNPDDPFPPQQTQPLSP